MKLNLYACRNCGQPKAPAPGTYCIGCAVKWDSGTKEYLVARLDTIDEILEKTEWAREYVEDRMSDAFERCCIFVVFRVKDKWMDMNIHEMYYRPGVIDVLLKRISEEA